MGHRRQRMRNRFPSSLAVPRNGAEPLAASEFGTAPAMVSAPRFQRTKDTTRKGENMKNAKRFVIVGNGNWGLYYGLTSDIDAKIIKAKAVRLYNCRHVCRWYCAKNGGITSLAAIGPGGPNVGQCRIGEPDASTLVLDVKAIHDCSPEAVKAFASVEAK